jgi:hypothetical protein
VTEFRTRTHGPYRVVEPVGFARSQLAAAHPTISRYRDGVPFR